MLFLNNVFLFCKRTANAIFATPIFILASLLLLISTPSIAQESFDLPTVTIPGVTNSSSTTEIIQAIIKYGGRFVVWSLVLVAGVVYIKSTVKAVAKVRRDEEGKWGDVLGEIIGGALVVMIVIALATWVTSTFLG